MRKDKNTFEYNIYRIDDFAIHFPEKIAMANHAFAIISPGHFSRFLCSRMDRQS